MKKENLIDMEDDLRPEYDLEKLLKDGVRGKYVERYRAGQFSTPCPRRRRGLSDRGRSE